MGQSARSSASRDNLFVIVFILDLSLLPDGVLEIVLVENAQDAEQTDGQTKQDNNQLAPHRVESQTENGDDETKQGDDKSYENHSSLLNSPRFQAACTFGKQPRKYPEKPQSRATAGCSLPCTGRPT